MKPCHRYIIGRERNVVLVDFGRQPDPSKPTFPGAAALRQMRKPLLTSQDHPPNFFSRPFFGANHNQSSRGRTMNREARNALIRAHQNNINRYCRLLATRLTEVERDYVHKRIVEETHALEKLLKSPRRWKSSAIRTEGQTDHSHSLASDRTLASILLGVSFAQGPPGQLRAFLPQHIQDCPCEFSPRGKGSGAMQTHCTPTVSLSTRHRFDWVPPSRTHPFP
jgi:hypothetical protein